MTTIIEQVRAQKEAVAAKHGFDVARMISAARERQEKSGRRIIRQDGADRRDVPNPTIP